jgi:DNA-binding NtrC family response regulator
MPDNKVLVIDDDVSITSTIANFLRSKRFGVSIANDSEDALEMIGRNRYQVILSDVYIDRLTGLDILREVRRHDPEACVILMTARGSVGTTVEAEAGGAFDYLAKPFDLKDLLSVIERGINARRRHTDEEATDDLHSFGGIIGFAPPMVEVYKRVARCAKSDDTVLILGESGTGKELVAKAIHEHSARKEKPFVPVDSGAVTGTLWEAEVFGVLKGAFTGADRDRAGLVDSALGGTVFFDEIGEIPLEFQAKLLRFLQEREYRPVGSSSPRKADVRVLAATNRNLEEMVRAGTFREDLFYRLNVLRIDLPPLRTRPTDIPFLAKRFLDDACESAGKKSWFDEAGNRVLAAYAWPGNVRQLENLVRRLVAMQPPGLLGEEVVLRELEDHSGFDRDEEVTELDAVERQQILKVLEQTGGNKTKAAETLGIQRRTLYKKLARIQRDAERA